MKGWDGENGSSDDSGNGNQQGFVDGKFLCIYLKIAVFLICFRSSVFEHADVHDDDARGRERGDARECAVYAR